MEGRTMATAVDRRGRATRKLPSKWLEASWVATFSGVKGGKGTILYTTNVIDKPDLFLWIRTHHYPQVTAREYRLAMRQMCRDQRPGYKPSPLHPCLRELLMERINAIGKRLWSSQVAELIEQAEREQLEETRAAVAKTKHGKGKKTRRGHKEEDTAGPSESAQSSSPDSRASAEFKRKQRWPADSAGRQGVDLVSSHLVAHNAHSTSAARSSGATSLSGSTRSDESEVSEPRDYVSAASSASPDNRDTPPGGPPTRGQTMDVLHLAGAPLDCVETQFDFVQTLAGDQSTLGAPIASRLDALEALQRAAFGGVYPNNSDENSGETASASAAAGSHQSAAGETPFARDPRLDGTQSNTMASAFASQSSHWGSCTATDGQTNAHMVGSGSSRTRQCTFASVPETAGAQGTVQGTASYTFVEWPTMDDDVILRDGLVEFGFGVAEDECNEHQAELR
jgi:hypothetical protein